MSRSANITRLDVLREFRSALIKFGDEANACLEAMQSESLKGLQWLEHDRPAYWQAQLKRAFELVAQSRTALSTCQLQKVAGRTPACIEQKVAHRRARERQQYCEQQLKVVRKWNIAASHEVDEYRGRVTALRRCVDGDIPHMIGLLDRSIAALESYAGVGRAASPVRNDESKSMNLEEEQS